MSANVGYIQRLSEGFVAEPQSVRAARRAAENVRGVLGSGACESVCLLVSELVTGAIRHGNRGSGKSVRMRVWTSPTSVRVAVTGRPPEASLPSEPGSGDLAVDGWGMYLMRRIADRWGVRRGPRAEVWFEIDTEART